jgi:hypothetical protein
MPITTEVDNDKQLTILRVVGEVSFKEIMTALKQFMEKQPTLNELWDFREGKLPTVTSGNLEQIAFYVRDNAHERAGGKSAFVASRDLEYGLSRMMRTLAEMKEVPLEIEVFRSFEEATQWLGEE